MTTQYRLNSLFSSVALSDFPYLNHSKTTFKPPAAYTIIDSTNVTEDEKYIFDMFLTALNVEPDSVDNYGSATYNNDVFSYHCPAHLGLKDAQLGMMIGREDETHKKSSLFIPCVVEQKVTRAGKREITINSYSLNGTPIKLTEQMDNDGKGTGKFFCTLEYTDGYEDYIFMFPILLDKKIEYTKEDINKAWKDGNFGSVLKEFGAGNGRRLWLKSNKAFTTLFAEKTFPRAGVLILARNAKYNVTQANEAKGIKNDIHEVDWEIIATSHPQLWVQYYNRESKTMAMTTLETATNIQFSSATKKNEGYNWFNDAIKQAKKKAEKPEARLTQTELDLIDGCYNEVVMIHIVSPSAMKIEHTPVNTVSNIVDRILPKIAAYPHLKLVAEELELGKGALPTTPVTVSPVFAGVSEKEAYDSLFQHRPSVPTQKPVDYDTTADEFLGSKDLVDSVKDKLDMHDDNDPLSF
jgi:hypothetical protein